MNGAEVPMFVPINAEEALRLAAVVRIRWKGSGYVSVSVDSSCGPISHAVDRRFAEHWLALAGLRGPKRCFAAGDCCVFVEDHEGECRDDRGRALGAAGSAA